MILFPVKSQPILVELLTSKLPFLDDLLDLLLSEAKEHILGLKVSMNNSADSVEKIKTHKNLPCNFLD